MPRVSLDYHATSRAREADLFVATAAMPGAGAFDAPIANPRIFRECLLTLGRVVQADFEWREEDYEDWYERVVDPVVGVHPDGVSFEGFSRDGSTAGWVHFDESIFGEPTVRRAGCTNIDYSHALEHALQRVNTASHSRLRIGAGEGVRLESDGATVHEKKINLPDDWLLGFGELHAALMQSEVAVTLKKPDLYNILRFLKQRRDVKKAKRALVFELNPGERPRARFEPWDHVLRLQGPPCDVDEPMELRVYGRRRLGLIESLIPLMKSATLRLVGDTRPSYWEMELPGATFTLALSAWTARRFTKSVTESLLAARAAVDDKDVQRAAAFLADAERCGFDELGEALGVDESEAVAVGLALCRQGLAVGEPRTASLRWRPLSLFPFAEVSARGATSREDRAADLLESGLLNVESVANREGLIVASASCEGSLGVYELELTLNADGSFATGDCDCPWIRRNGLKGGPCKHLLALREHAIKQLKESKKESNRNG